MATSLKDFIPHFFGRDVNDEGGQEDPAEFLENLYFAIDGQGYTDESRKLTATRVIFRTHLRDKALAWYHGLDANTRANWSLLEAAFLSRFALVARKEVDQTRFLNLVFNFRQRGRSIVEYTREGDQLNAECPEKFRDVLGHQFIAGLDDKGKIDLVQVYLGASKSTVSYADAKLAVEKAYQRFGEPGPFDHLYDQPSPPPPTPALQTELVALLQSLRVPQAPLPRDNLFYRQHYNNANARDQNGRPSFYRGIYCHNCREEGHYSTSCTRPIVSGAQREANRRAIDELQGAPRQYPRGPGPVSSFLPAQVAPAAVANSRGERKEQGGRRMNNIGGANVVILKRPTAEKADHDSENHVYPITAATRSQKKNLEAKKFQPTSRVTKPAGRNSEKSLGNQTSKNLNRLSERTIRSPSLSPPPPEDDEMEDSVTIRGDSYGMRGALDPGQERQVRFEDQNDGAYDRPTPQHYQQKTPPPPKPQEVIRVETDQSITKETIPIKMAEGKSRFQVDTFLDTQVTLSIWQLLDRSPQLRVQLARAMASSRPTKRSKKSVVPNPVRTAAAVSKLWTPPAIETITHEDEEVICLYIDAWVGDQKISKTLVDSGAVVELISRKVVQDLDLQVYHMNEKWTLQLADDGHATVQEYVWVTVNVSGVRALVKAFILGDGQVYDLLLSKRWMYRVRAVEDHGAGTLTISGTDGLKRVVDGQEADSLAVELVDALEVEDLGMDLADEEVYQLIDEANEAEYYYDQVKGQRL